MAKTLCSQCRRPGLDPDQGTRSPHAATKEPVWCNKDWRSWERQLRPVHAKSLQSCPTLCNPMGYRPPGSSTHGFSRHDYWSGLPRPPPGDLPNPGIKLTFLTTPALACKFFTTSATWEDPVQPNKQIFFQ